MYQSIVQFPLSFLCSFPVYCKMMTQLKIKFTPPQSSSIIGSEIFLQP